MLTETSTEVTPITASIRRVKEPSLSCVLCGTPYTGRECAACGTEQEDVERAIQGRIRKDCEQKNGLLSYVKGQPWENVVIHAYRITVSPPCALSTEQPAYHILGPPAADGAPPHFQPMSGDRRWYSSN